MSPDLHAEMIRARQQEIAARSLHAGEVGRVGASASRRSGRIRPRAARPSPSSACAP
jgi:hypothetical protein